MGWAAAAGCLRDRWRFFAMALSAVLFAAACARPIGSHFRHDDEPVEWVTETCDYLAGLDADAPWPMFQARYQSAVNVGMISVSPTISR